MTAVAERPPSHTAAAAVAARRPEECSGSLTGATIAAWVREGAATAADADMEEGVAAAAEAAEAATVTRTESGSIHS
jgi:hypothetical protein